jgi:hypothetical protein
MFLHSGKGKKRPGEHRAFSFWNNTSPSPNSRELFGRREGRRPFLI